MFHVKPNLRGYFFTLFLQFEAYGNLRRLLHRVSVLRPRRPCSDGMERPASDRYAASAEGSDRRP